MDNITQLMPIVDRKCVIDYLMRNGMEHLTDLLEIQPSLAFLSCAPESGGKLLICYLNQGLLVFENGETIDFSLGAPHIG